jgi:hypothetical protein
MSSYSLPISINAIIQTDMVIASPALNHKQPRVARVLALD